MLVLGSDPDDLRATAQTVENTMGQFSDVTVVSLLHCDGDGLSRGGGQEGKELSLMEGPWAGCWALPEAGGG